MCGPSSLSLRVQFGTIWSTENCREPPLQNHCPWLNEQSKNGPLATMIDHRSPAVEEDLNTDYVFERFFASFKDFLQAFRDRSLSDSRLLQPADLDNRTMISR